MSHYYENPFYEDLVFLKKLLEKNLNKNVRSLNKLFFEIKTYELSEALDKNRLQ